MPSTHAAPMAYPNLSYPRILTQRENAAIDAQCITHRYPDDHCASGLLAGDVWSDGGTLKVIP